MTKTNKLPMVVIFGRANVGKSTLFNALVEKKQALVSPIAGTTRDSNIGEVSWRGKKFKLIDTGGIMDIEFLLRKKIKAEDIEEKVQKQARRYMGRADLVLFVVDGKEGIIPDDKKMALAAKKVLPAKNNIIYVINKVDSPAQRKNLAEFHKFPLGEPIPVSAVSGSGTGDLLDIIVEKIKTAPEIENLLPKANLPLAEKFKIENIIKVCIIGKPNVGKSSLLNSILGEERVIVSPIPHTTREPQDTDIIYQEQPIKLIDTAGISKKGGQISKIKKIKLKIKNYSDLEAMGIAKSLHALGKSDIALLVIDINEPLTRQDLKIVEEITERKRGLIIIANKWDLTPERDTKKFTDYIRAHLPFAVWAPIQFISAKTGEKVKKILDLIIKINKSRQMQISDSQAEKFLKQIVKIHRPARGRGVKHPRIYEFKQVGTNPPKFELRIGRAEDLHESYVRFIENRLREKLDLTGTPIKIRVEKGKKVHGTHNK